MVVQLSEIRDLLLPGLLEICGSYAAIPAMWEDAFMDTELFVADELPAVPLPVAVAMGAAAVIIKNPTVSRRFWSRMLS